ncbi:MAG: acyl-CoA dehydrogenase family protein [Acidimicrobiales bacterium]
MNRTRAETCHTTTGAAMSTMNRDSTELEGAHGLLDTRDGWPGYFTQRFLYAPSLTIAGGSSEVQRNIIGERVLGLPGEPKVTN